MKKHKRIISAFIVVIILAWCAAVPCFALDGFTTFDKWDYSEGYDIYEADTNMLYSCTPFTITWFDQLSLLDPALQGFHGFGGYAGAVSVSKDSSAGTYTLNADLVQSDQRQEVNVYPSASSTANRSEHATTRYYYSSYGLNMFNFSDQNVYYDTNVLRSAAVFDVDNHHYYYCDAYPFGCQMEADNIVLHTSMLELPFFDEGIGGISIPYTVSPGGSPLWDWCTYLIEYDITNSIGVTRHYENGGTYKSGVISNGTRLYLIPSEDYSVEDHEKGEWLLINNLKITYKFGEETWSPTNQTVPSFTYYSFDTMLAVSDNSVPFDSALLDSNKFLVEGSYSGTSPISFYGTLVQNERYLSYEKGVEAGKATSNPGGIPGLTRWIGSTVGGFLDVNLFGDFSIGGILAVVVAMGFLFMILRYFAGG